MLKVADLSKLFEEVDEIAVQLPPEAKGAFDLVSAVVHIQIDMDMRIRALEPCIAHVGKCHVWEDIAFPQGMSCRNCGVPKLSPMMREEPAAEVSAVASAILGVRQSETIDLRIVGATEVAAASEALATVEEHVRRALCAVLDRLGADGATAFINGDSPEKVSDAIFAFVREEQARIGAELGAERDNALNMLDVANEVIGEVRGVCKAGDDELTVMAVRRALRQSAIDGPVIALSKLLRGDG